MEISPLYINPEDTREMVEELIRKSDSEKLLLIFAGHTSSNISIVDLQLLHRQVKSRGKQLAIATRNAKLSDAADHLGIPLFRTPSQARRDPWKAMEKPPDENGKIVIDGHKVPQRYHPSKKSRQWWEWGLLGISLLLVIALGLLLFSRATITIEPIPQTQSLPLEVIASTTVRAANLAGETPLHSGSLILEATTSGETSGVLSFPEGYASGTLTITNLTSEDLDLPAGLTVQTVEVQPVQFITNSALRLAPAGEDGDSGKVEITAKAPGRDGNVIAGEILAATGEYGSSISVRNAGAMFGGYNRHVNTPSEEDISSLHDFLIGELLSQALIDYEEQMTADGFVLLPDTILIDEILSEEVVPLTGEPADEFHLTLRVSFSAGYIEPADLKLPGEQLMDAGLEDGYTAVDDQLMITTVTAPQANEDGSYRWSILLHRQIIPDLSDLDLSSFGGQPRRKLQTWFVDSFPYIENITIKTQPGFWWWLPVLPRRMEVIVL